MNREKYNKIGENLVVPLTCMAVNGLAEHGITKAAMMILENVIPGNIGRFSKFAIRFGIAVVYETTVGEKVASYLGDVAKQGWELSGDLNEQLGFIDSDSEENYTEMETEEAGA